MPVRFEAWMSVHWQVPIALSPQALAAAESDPPKVQFLCGQLKSDGWQF